MYNVLYVKTALKKIMNRTSPVQSHWFFISTWKQVCVMPGTAAKVRVKSHPLQWHGLQMMEPENSMYRKKESTLGSFFFIAFYFKSERAKGGGERLAWHCRKLWSNMWSKLMIVILFINLICTGLQWNALDCDITKWRVISWLLICRCNSPKIPFQICVTFLTRVEIN